LKEETNESSESNELKITLGFHPADEVAADKHDFVRDECKKLAYKLEEELPDSREKALAMTKLEEVMLWGNAAVARNKVSK